ncbi:hypothetical protein [Priestia megaterium]
MLRRNFLKSVLLFIFTLLFGFLFKREGRIVRATDNLPSVHVDSYGAKGDGLTNDTVAFQKACAVINQAGGGTLILSKKIYIVGLQDLAGTGGKRYSYKGQDIIKIQNCSKNLIIEGNGATLRAANGLKFGSFNPLTGAVYNPNMPFTNLDYRADVYYAMIHLLNNEKVIVKDLELDGNLENLTLGGLWGDRGRQCSGSGIMSVSNNTATFTNIYTHHQPLDGITIVKTNMTEEDDKNPHTLINVNSEYNARQGLSWTGGIGLTSINCKFNHTGKSRFMSSPGAGVDIEAQNSVCRDGMFFNCEIINNSGGGVVADSGDGGYTTFRSCIILGTTNWAVWPNKPQMRFEKCKIYGGIVNAYGSKNQKEATQFLYCEIEDKQSHNYNVYNPNYLINIGGDNILFEGCEITANTNKAIATMDKTKEEIFSNCIINHNNDRLPDKSFVSTFNGSKLRNTIFKELYVNPPKNGYFINVNDVNIEGIVIVEGPKTKWRSWSEKAGAVTGLLPFNN